MGKIWDIQRNLAKVRKRRMVRKEGGGHGTYEGGVKFAVSRIFFGGEIGN